MTTKQHILNRIEERWINIYKADWDRISIGTELTPTTTPTQFQISDSYSELLEFSKELRDLRMEIANKQLGKEAKEQIKRFKELNN